MRGFVSKNRVKLTKQFLVDRCKYIENLYAYLKKKIDKRVQMIKNRQNIEIDEKLDESVDDDKARPVIDVYSRNSKISFKTPLAVKNLSRP